MESLSAPPSTAGKDVSIGKKPQLWMLLFSLLQMGASCSKTIPLKCIKKKKLGQILSPEFKKACLIFFCDTEWPWYPLEYGEC